MSKTDYLAALQGALNSCHAGIYAYGVIAARASGELRTQAETRRTELVKKRDQLTEKLTGLDGTPLAAAAGYVIAEAETSAAHRAIAQKVEATLASSAAALVAAGPPPERRAAADWLSEITQRSLAWGAELTPFPGLNR